MQSWSLCRIFSFLLCCSLGHHFTHLHSPLCWNFQKQHYTKLTRFSHASFSATRCSGFANSMLNTVFTMLLRRKGTFAEDLHHHWDLYAWISEYDACFSPKPAWQMVKGDRSLSSCQAGSWWLQQLPNFSFPGSPPLTSTPPSAFMWHFIRENHVQPLA